MSDDLYSILGVSRAASQEEIREAYRKLAKDLHADLHPGDKAAEDRFKSVFAAYAILEDPEERARYDRGEIDETGAERPQHRYYREYADAGGARHYETTAGFEDFVDLSDIFADVIRRGRRGAQRGTDLRYHLSVDFLDAVNGTTKRVTMSNGATLDVKIPPGVRNDQTLRLKGKGTPGVDNGPAGDALIEIHVKTHPVFSREKDDIVIELPITID